MLESASLTLFLGGDGGYGPHFRQIGRSFPSIDWAILENGQYSKDWKYIHTMPEQQEKVISDLNAKRVVTIHHSKYALSSHPWDEPIKTAEYLRKRKKTECFHSYDWRGSAARYRLAMKNVMPVCVSEETQTHFQNLSNVFNYGRILT